ncbi:MAG TPA: hypothetical protein VF042_14000 [Gemmatimonadaceae bacterium]
MLNRVRLSIIATALTIVAGCKGADGQESRSSMERQDGSST